MASSLPPLPGDPAVPLAAAVADAELLLALVSGAVDGAVVRVRPRYLEYVPGAWLRLQVEVQTVEPAGASDERTTQSVVVSQPPELGATPGAHRSVGRHSVFRFPDDPALVALRHHEGRLLAWVPCQRAVLRRGDEVLKFHADARSLHDAVQALQLVRGVVAAPEIVRVLHAEHAYVQRAVDGRPLERSDAGELAGAAAALVRRLHDSALGSDEARAGLVRGGPQELLALCRPVVALVTHARPQLAERIGTVLDTLERHAGAAAADEHEWVASHGDFNVGQLLVGDDGALTVVDTDTLCLAPRPFDLASYAANVVSGRAADLAEAQQLLARLVTGYGALGAAGERALPWYFAAMVLRRADRGLRRVKRDWPARTDRLVDAAEVLTADVGGEQVSERQHRPTPPR